LAVLGCCVVCRCSHSLLIALPLLQPSRASSLRHSSVRPSVPVPRLRLLSDLRVVAAAAAYPLVSLELTSAGQALEKHSSSSSPPTGERFPPCLSSLAARRQHLLDSTVSANMADARRQVERSEMERCLKQNLENVYYVCRIRKQTKPSEVPVFLFTVDSIYGDWSEQNYLVEPLVAEKATALGTGAGQDVSKIFRFLASSGRRLCCGVVIKSKAEVARTEIFCIDFDVLLPELEKLPVDNDRTAAFCERNASHIDKRWGLGARVFTDQAWGMESRGFFLLPISRANAAQRTAAQSMADREFATFAGDVRAILDKPDSLGYFALVDFKVAGFILFTSTTNDWRVTVDIKYLLVASEHRGGLGSDLVSALLDEVMEQNREKAVYITTDIKTTSEQATNFWLKKKGFLPREDEEYIEGQFQPVEKTYAPAHLHQKDDPESE